MQDTQGSSSHATIGILALQGAFAEHQTMLQKVSKHQVTTILVRTPEDLAQCDALIIPGGESTTIALLAKLSGLLEPLKEFVQTKVVWGTCAGAILLAQHVSNPKKGGQEVLGGMTLTVARNGWGSQVESFEAPLEIDGLRDSNIPFIGIFIRAPVIQHLTPTPSSPPIKIVARLPPGILPPPHPTSTLPSTEIETAQPHPDETIVALRQGRHLLTTFHPELTRDHRFHEYFVKECVLPFVESESP
ncbi:SNO glutamine amidotransferase [Stereum hirsutum FP-91666 SS1]|uniref:SNO glutamine amidotransferase n=1 Tax=Stereum hirsutum (strain FP-91666) TaxID=721885 RepID=UPI00044495A1|nr:SNO glutamine amidotransferase [Stereum hirsutum FP-91666 SS1]EIM85331.1 SNO glutamine amidotransferase [Stereum hirsutum FP-91666 SS1]